MKKIIVLWLISFSFSQQALISQDITVSIDRNTQSIDINDYLKPKTNSNNSVFFKSLNFLKVDNKRFPIIKLKNRINEHISTPIIINAANEILVDQYLKEKISFDTFYKYLLQVLKDRNYRKYAIKEPKNINQIFLVDEWSRSTVYKKINYKNA